jgi:AcrR family transcriptional regulator
MTPKPPKFSARAELAAITHERVMQAMASLLRAGVEVTFKALAEASGVPERTIYRRYAAKEALLAAFWPWLNDKLGMPDPPTDSGQLVRQIPDLFAAFEADELLVRAMLHDPHGQATRLAAAAARRDKFERALAEDLAQLSPKARRRLLAALQALVSAAAWETIKDYRGISAAEAADAAQWAADALLQAALREAAAQE